LKTKKAILFDLDGTLTDPMLGITKSVRYALQHFGIAVESLETLTPFIGPPLAGSFREFYGFSEAQSLEALEKYREYFGTIGLFENEVYAGIVDLLAALKNHGKQIYLATSKPTVYATKILEHFGLAQYVDFIGGSKLSGERVEKAEVIQYVLDTQGIDKKDAVMVGDRKFDIEGGRHVGIGTIGVLYGYGSEAEMKEANADILVSTVAELKTTLL